MCFEDENYNYEAFLYIAIMSGIPSNNKDIS